MAEYNPRAMRISVNGAEVSVLTSIADVDWAFGRGSVLSGAVAGPAPYPAWLDSDALRRRLWAERVIRSIPKPLRITAVELRARGLAEGWLR